jgi:hypothetical protein
MSTPLTRSQAKTWTIGAQVGALVCVLGAVAVGVVGLDPHEQGAALEVARANALPMTGSNANSKKQQREIDPYRSQSVDTLGLAERLALLDNAPNIPVEQQTGDEDPTTGNPEPEDGPSIDDANLVRRVKYIGFINSSTTQHAFIRIDGKQRIVSVGQTARAGDDQFDDVEIIRVTPDFIRISDGIGRADIRLATKSGPAVTMVDGTEIETVAATPTNGSLLTAEEEAYIESLPPRQRQPARRRLEREKRGLPPENENRRPTPEPLVRIRGNAAADNQPANVQRRDQRND